jgi:hypothetical protein
MYARDDDNTEEGHNDFSFFDLDTGEFRFKAEPHNL